MVHKTHLVLCKHGALRSALHIQAAQALQHRARGQTRGSNHTAVLHAVLRQVCQEGQALQMRVRVRDRTQWQLKQARVIRCSDECTYVTHQCEHVMLLCLGPARPVLKDNADHGGNDPVESLGRRS